MTEGITLVILNFFWNPFTDCGFYFSSCFIAFTLILFFLVSSNGLHLSRFKLCFMCLCSILPYPRRERGSYHFHLCFFLNFGLMMEVTKGLYGRGKCYSNQLNDIFNLCIYTYLQRCVTYLHIFSIRKRRELLLLSHLFCFVL